MKVLILASNPRKDLSIDREIRDLREVIEKSHSHKDFEVVDALAVRVTDLQQLLFKYEPQIVHFCGHGSGQQGLVFQDENEKEQWVRSEALSELFRLFSSSVKCVLLNACYSEMQADAIVSHIDYVVGMRQEIQDDAAIAFSKGFYQALGYNRSIEQAFEFGRNAIQLEISGGSRVRSAKTNQNRKIEVVDAIEQTPIPEHIKPILKVKSTLSVSTEENRRVGNQAIPEELRTAIQLAIDKSLRHDADIHSFASREGALTSEADQSSQKAKEGAGQAKSYQHGHSYFKKVFAILGIAGFAVMCSWVVVRITTPPAVETPVAVETAVEDEKETAAKNEKQKELRSLVDQVFGSDRNLRRAATSKLTEEDNRPFDTYLVPLLIDTAQRESDNYFGIVNALFILGKVEDNVFQSHSEGIMELVELGKKQLSPNDKQTYISPVEDRLGQ